MGSLYTNFGCNVSQVSALGIVKEMFCHAVIVRVGNVGESWPLIGTDGLGCRVMYHMVVVCVRLPWIRALVPCGIG